MRRFAVIHSSLFLAVVLALSALSVVRMPPLALPDRSEVRVGQAARQFENHYDEVFPAKTLGINFWAAVQYLAFREGRSGVIVGNDDWLYSLEEFRGWPLADQQVAAHLRHISDVRRQLAERGTTLLVALVPAKADLYTEHWGEHRPDPLHNNLYQGTLDALHTAGVVAPDLQAALATCKRASPVFLRTDTHWTPLGARCAANAIADTASQAGLATRNPQTFVTTTEAAREHLGDLTNFLPLAPHFAQLLPAADHLELLHTESAQVADLLADTPAAEVVLVGTSYSADPRWNFDGSLRERLHEDVLNLAESGHGPFQPMHNYLEDPSSPPARVLIWEIPVRYLPMQDPAAAQHPKSTGESA